MINAMLYAVNIGFAYLGRSCRWRGRMCRIIVYMSATYLKYLSHTLYMGASYNW